MIRCSDDKAGYCSNFNGMKISFLKSLMVARTPHQRESRISTNYPTSVAAASASPLFSGQVTRDSCGLNFYKDVCNSLFWQFDFMETNFHVYSHIAKYNCSNYVEFLTLLVYSLQLCLMHLTNSPIRPLIYLSVSDLTALSFSDCLFSFLLCKCMWVLLRSTIPSSCLNSATLFALRSFNFLMEIWG